MLRFRGEILYRSRIQIVAIRKVGETSEVIVLNGLPNIEPSLDDWFSWKECCQSTGWEVELGEVFSGSENELRELIEAFIHEHMQREQDDWASYGYMLNDYVGVDRQGKGNCLRAVMLGYLKTNEIVVGDNCYSCSRCVPDEQFSRDLEQRKSVVQLLRQEIIEIISDLEQKYAEELVPEEKLAHLWNPVQQEERRRRSVHPYLQGWSGRILTDTPDHKTAHLIRLEAIYRGYWSLQVEEFLNHLRRLLTLCNQEELRRIQYLFTHIRQQEQENPQILAIMAEFYRKQGLLEEELAELKLLARVRPTYEVVARIIQVSENLGVSSSELQPYYLQLARLTPNLEEAMQLYAKTDVFRDNDSIISESIYLLDDRTRQTAKATRLLREYLDRKPSWILQELFDLGEYWSRTRQSHRLQAVDGDDEVCQQLTRLFAQYVSEATRDEQYRLLSLSKEFGTEPIFLRTVLVAADTGAQQLAFVELISTGNDEPIVESIERPDFQFVREALLYFAQKKHTKALEKALYHPNPAIRKLACWLILRSNPEKAKQILEQLTHDNDNAVRRFACRCAARYRVDSVLSLYLNDDDIRVRKVATRALRLPEKQKGFLNWLKNIIPKIFSKSKMK